MGAKFKQELPICIVNLQEKLHRKEWVKDYTAVSDAYHKYIQKKKKGQIIENNTAQVMWPQEKVCCIPLEVNLIQI